MLYAVPFHIHRAGGRLLGFDAFFWPHLEARYRVVLLIHPADALLEEPPRGSCVLPAKVSPSRQVEDVLQVARMKTPPIRAPRPSLARRLAELLVPYKLLALGDEEASVPEEAQARSLARMIGRPEPAGVTGWAVFEDKGDAILPRAPENMRRIYAELRSRDPGYRGAEGEARSFCRERSLASG